MKEIEKNMIETHCRSQEHVEQCLSLARALLSSGGEPEHVLADMIYQRNRALGQTFGDVIKAPPETVSEEFRQYALAICQGVSPAEVPDQIDTVARGIFEALCLKMSRGKCPTKGCLGEVCAMDYEGPVQPNEHMYVLYVNVWEDTFNDTSGLVEQIKQWGAVDVMISHVLHDTLNYDRDGRDTEGNCRRWFVRIYLREA